MDVHTPAAGDAIHAGINSKDAIVTTLTGSTSNGKNHDSCEGTEAGPGQAYRKPRDRKDAPRAAPRRAIFSARGSNSIWVSTLAPRDPQPTQDENSGRAVDQRRYASGVLTGANRPSGPHSSVAQDDHVG